MESELQKQSLVGLELLATLLRIRRTRLTLDQVEGPWLNLVSSRFPQTAGSLGAEGMMVGDGSRLRGAKSELVLGGGFGVFSLQPALLCGGSGGEWQ
jgi:hypothetical protein